MVKSSASKRVSAFAVAQAHTKGADKLDESLTVQLLNDVKGLHTDAKFNKRAADVASNYERNLLTSKKKKLKRRKERKLAAALALAGKSKQHNQEGNKGEERDPAEAPLSWYNAPKSDKRIKLVESEKTQTRPSKAKKQKTAKKPMKKSVKKTTKPAEKLGLVSSTDEQALLETRPAYKSAGSRCNGKKSDKTSNKKPDSLTAKKVSVEEWTPADISNTDNMSDLSIGSDELLSSDDSSSDAQDGSEQVAHEDPEQAARELFTRLLHPHDVKTFFRKTWLKKPLHIKRKNGSYYKDDEWFSTEELDRILAQERVRFGVNIDLTSFKDGKRETHNPAGRAYPSIVWDHYQQGCSVRLLNPQTYSEGTWQLLSTLQELFGCMVGANVYLTPPGTQGFAPHYDDIEAFVLQLEGSKHWKVYGPRTDADIWPLTSSPNLTEEGLGKPIIDCILEQGDLLYFPRGAIHQAMAQDNQHSLHITVSTHQKNSWSDLLNVMMPAAIANAAENDPEFRESLPNDYLNYTGIAFQEQEGAPRQAFLTKLQKLMDKLMTYAPVDGACDLMAKKFVHDSLPPHLNSVERLHTIADQGEKWVNDEVRDAVELQHDTRVRLLRKHSLRIVSEPTTDDKTSPSGAAAVEEAEEVNEGADNVIRVYYNTDNDRLYHGNDLQYFDVDGDLAPAIEFLQISCPQFVSIDEFPLEDITLKMDVAMQLYEKGLLITEERLECSDSQFSDDESQSDEG